MTTFTVKFAVYGALNGGDENKTQAIDVSGSLQKKLVANNGIVTIDNATFGTDPSKGNKKHFGALVTVNGTDQYFACEENQTIDFCHSMTPDK